MAGHLLRHTFVDHRADEARANDAVAKTAALNVMGASFFVIKPFVDMYVPTIRRAACSRNLARV